MSLFRAERMGSALCIAARAHDGHHRKGSDLPYISYPLAVAVLVIEYGGAETQVLAALLHGAVEDGGAAYTSLIRYELGEEVLRLVEALRDPEPEHMVDPAGNTGELADLRQRKQSHVDRLVAKPVDVLMVSACDKLHGVRGIRADLAQHGLAAFDRFAAPHAETLWYYGALADALGERLHGAHPDLASALRAETRALHDEARVLEPGR